MLRKCFIAGFLLFVLFSRTNGQSPTVESYTNQLLFNIFMDQPDTAIRPFLRLYAPSLLEKKTVPEGNTSSGSQSSNEIHSFLFTKHPFFKSTFSTGKLELHCQHFTDARGLQVYDIKLWFEFDTQQDGEIAYSKLIETFMPISKARNLSSASGAMKAEFSENKDSKGLSKIQFRLTADNLDKRMFKILFELGNDLK
jgi:hypothetical protein